MKNNGGSTSSLLKHLQGKHPQVYLSATGATADGILDSSETIDVKPRSVEIDEGENKDEEDEDGLSDRQEAGYVTDDETWVYIHIYVPCINNFQNMKIFLRMFVLMPHYLIYSLRTKFVDFAVYIYVACTHKKNAKSTNYVCIYIY